MSKIKKPEGPSPLSHGKAKHDSSSIRERILQAAFTPIRERGFSSMYTTDRLHACFRQTEVLDLAFGDQLLDSTSHIFDRHFRINAVLVEDVDTIGPQTI
jgi:hypothetical protein